MQTGDITYTKCRLFAFVAFTITCACEQGASNDASRIGVVGGEPEQGALVIEMADCGACHTIPGIDRANGTVGPPLTFWSKRSYIAGSVPNLPHNLVEWLIDPHGVEPGTAMPDVGLTRQQARDVAAYLYTLE
ncbi:MAG: c-type cytochrome [Proteobacteria bacterium]|nr:c-type cytochrome [Pseudomonadota bacterium]